MTCYVSSSLLPMQTGPTSWEGVHDPKAMDVPLDLDLAKRTRGTGTNGDHRLGCRTRQPVGNGWDRRREACRVPGVRLLQHDAGDHLREKSSLPPGLSSASYGGCRENFFV